MDTSPLTRQQCREIDRRAIEVYGISSLVLMENAGRGCADVLERLGIDGPVLILCGKGNNAGDGFVIARHLEMRGYTCKLFLLESSLDLKGDAATNFNILEHSDILSAELPPVAGSWPSEVIYQLLDGIRRDSDWVVDAMLGTGARGSPRPPYDAAIDWFNAQSCKKLAVDVPSGLDCDTGQPTAHTVRADHTCTFAAMKIGFTQPAAKPFTGTIHVCDIGVPPQVIADIAK